MQTLGANQAIQATAIRKETTTEEMASRIYSATARLQSIIGNLGGTADRLFGTRPEGLEAAQDELTTRGSVDNLDRAIRQLDGTIGMLADTSSRFNEI